MYKTFSEAFADYLDQEGLTQQAAGGLAGISQPVIGKIRRGVTPEGGTIVKLSNGLGIDIKHSGDGWTISKMLGTG